MEKLNKNNKKKMAKKNQIKPNKTQKKPAGLGFFLKTRIFANPVADCHSLSIPTSAKASRAVVTMTRGNLPTEGLTFVV